jgi:hypothetical protein
MISFLKSFNVKNIILILILSLNLNITHAGDVIHLEVEQLKNTLIHNKKDKILVFFMTWCTHCKPITLSKTLPKNRMVFISVDENPEAIKEFAKDMIYDVYHVMPSEDLKNLVTLSESLGIKFAIINKEGGVSTSMPYIAHLDGDNKVLADDIKPEHLQKYLN